MKVIGVLLGVTAAVAAWSSGARAQSVNADQAFIQNVVNWFNATGYAWTHQFGQHGTWVNVSAVAPPSGFQWSTSEVVYGQPSGLSPVKPEGLETLLAVNCNGPEQGPLVVKMVFSQSVQKTATTTVTQGVTVSEALTFSASVPSWGIGASSTSTVQYSTTTSSSKSVSITYSYSFTNTVTLQPGLKQEATLMVGFQDVVIPWSANVGYVGNDTISSASYWMDWSREPNPEQYGQHFAQMPGTLASVLPPNHLTFQAQGTFQGAYAANAQAVDGPTQEMSAADKQQYCGQDLRGAKVVRVPVRAIR